MEGQPTQSGDFDPTIELARHLITGKPMRMGVLRSSEFTTEQTEQGRRIAEYYQGDLPEPDDDETSRPSPIKTVQ